MDAVQTTAEELLRMPRGRWRRELVRGELRMMEPTGIEHGRVALIAGGVLRKLREWLAAGTVAVVVLDSAERTATVHRDRHEARVHGPQDTLDLSDAVPGFRPMVAELLG
jgi:Uma2 family endonuclease